MKQKIISYALMNSFATALYIILVASFMYFLSQTMSADSKSVIIPVAMLMLLVFSVALVGSLIFGRAVIWYLDSKKKEAVLLIVYTLGILFVITILVFLVLISYS